MRGNKEIDVPFDYQELDLTLAAVGSYLAAQQEFLRRARSGADKSDLKQDILDLQRLFERLEAGMRELDR